MAGEGEVGSYCAALRERFKLGPGIVDHVNDDPRSGREKGLVCRACKDAVVGVHPDDRRRARVIA
ncbi:MAG TPA: hypothetical protein VLW85_14845 [Myxococcales bacterium]|nr:hypothetical protein [Myxococcales bacterium]